jgi:hypothetical protein
VAFTGYPGVSGLCGDLTLDTSGAGSAGDAALKDWLLAAKATNMASMLPAQLGRAR